MNEVEVEIGIENSLTKCFDFIPLCTKYFYSDASYEVSVHIIVSYKNKIYNDIVTFEHTVGAKRVTDLNAFIKIAKSELVRHILYHVIQSDKELKPVNVDHLHLTVKEIERKS